MTIQMNKLGEQLAHEIEREITRGREKFPTNRHLHAALMEEVGEVANALLEFENGNKSRIEVRQELIQVIAVAVRLIQEGTAEFSFRGDFNLPMTRERLKAALEKMVIKP